LTSGALKAREDTIPEPQADSKKPCRLVFEIRHDSSKNSVDPVNSDDEQLQQSESAALVGSEHAPLLKGLYKVTHSRSETCSQITMNVENISQ